MCNHLWEYLPSTSTGFIYWSWKRLNLSQCSNYTYGCNLSRPVTGLFLKRLGRLANYMPVPRHSFACNSADSCTSAIALYPIQLDIARQQHAIKEQATGRKRSSMLSLMLSFSMYITQLIVNMFIKGMFLYICTCTQNVYTTSIGLCINPPFKGKKKTTSTDKRNFI